jgi:hypothetical protein
VNRFIDHLYTPLGTTSTYYAIADSHTLKITTAPAKHFPACCVFTSHSLATASNSGDSSASRGQSSCHSHPCRTLVNCQLNYTAIYSQPSLHNSTDCQPSTLNRIGCSNSLLYNHFCMDRIENTFSNNNYCFRSVFTNPLHCNGCTCYNMQEAQLMKSREVSKIVSCTEYSEVLNYTAASIYSLCHDQVAQSV